MDTQYIEIILNSMEDEIKKLTTGNLAHKKASLLWAVSQLKEEVKEKFVIV